MIYHGQVRGLNGQIYQCEHNHRTETAAVACAHSSFKCSVHAAFARVLDGASTVGSGLSPRVQCGDRRTAPQREPVSCW
jgi:hypothetical protein